MKALLVPVPPEVCARIANGKQTFLFLKRLPKIHAPYNVYMFCSNGKSSLVYSADPEDIAWCRPHIDIANNRVWTTHNSSVRKYCKDREWNGKVIGVFSCDNVSRCGCQFPPPDNYKPTYSFHITDLKIYDKPKELGEFFAACHRLDCDQCGDCPHLRVELCVGDIDAWCGVGNSKPLTRPPQSWQYIEELN